MNQIISKTIFLSLAFLHKQILQAPNLSGRRAKISRSAVLGFQVKHVCYNVVVFQLQWGQSIVYRLQNKHLLDLMLTMD